MPALVFAASLLLVQTAQAQTEQGVSTRTVGSGSAVVGQPYAFTVEVTNNSAPQSVGLKNFLPEGMTLESATPSQGTCSTPHHGAGGLDCTLGELPTGGSATVDIVATPAVPGTATNTAVGQGEFAPADTDEVTITVNPAG